MKELRTARDARFVDKYIESTRRVIPGLDAGDGMHVRARTRTRGDAVLRFNIYGLKYSRNHTGGGECEGMTCRTRARSIRMTRRGLVRTKIIYIKRCRAS